MEESGQIDTEEYKKLQTEIDESSSRLKELKTQKKQVDNEFGHPISPEGMDALQREIIETTNDYKALRKRSEVQMLIWQKYLRYPESLEIRSKEWDNPCCR